MVTTVGFHKSFPPFNFGKVSGVRSFEAAEIALHLGNADALHDILDPKSTIQDVILKYTPLSHDNEGEMHVSFIYQ